MIPKCDHYFQVQVRMFSNFSGVMCKDTKVLDTEIDRYEDECEDSEGYIDATSVIKRFEIANSLDEVL